MAIVQCVREKRDRNIFRNILYKTRAIFMKFGTWLTQKFKLGQKGEYLQISNSNRELFGITPCSQSAHQI